MSRPRAQSEESHVSTTLKTLSGALAPQESFNDLGSVAALDRHRPSIRSLGRRKSFTERNLTPLTAGGLRQSVITLVQTSLGGGVLTLAFAMRLSGLGLASVLMLVLGILAYSGMEIMMRGAVHFQTFDTSTLLARCVGSWSGPAMDCLLVLYGNGAMVAYFILLGDFLPAIFQDLVDYGVVAAPQDLDPQDLRTRCIFSTLLLVVPLCLLRKLSALRYCSPIALVAVLYTAVVIVMKAPALFIEHQGKPLFGEVQWFVMDLGFFHSFSILLFAFNCHLNVIPVASELTDQRDVRINKICARVAVVEVIFYLLIALGGYLSFLGATEQNILKNYGNTISVTICRTLLAFTILVGIPTNMLPTVRSEMGVVDCFRGKGAAPSSAAPLLSANDGFSDDSPSTPAAHEAPEHSEVLRLSLSFLSIACQVYTAIKVPNVADVMGFLGGSVGTVLMMVLPLVVLFKAPPESWSALRFWATALLLLSGMIIAFTSVGLQLAGK